LGASIPLIALALQNHSHLFPLIFMFSGLFVSTFKIAMSGILVEISNNENRTLYAGMSGAGNILTTLFPLGAGFLIQTIGYDWVFVMISISMLSSFLFVRKLVCR
jgi:hypothetical protein